MKVRLKKKKSFADRGEKKRTKKLSKHHMKGMQEYNVGSL